ncbi:argininosuccinate lyase [Thermosulfuriphilus ammonigenes]|uniref:Argininosuccinate lyase n=1 Tax=Thermosulfuriphilus ammonigenes TaxID=1936021 RepID=A0A6G7PVM4_9BACT|nr:argininosuccinate lyase [Thermosulfuriphilus ammonigenes]MBA2848155.1 argininosuccinate lyase [Thermosulfuriphilus ammonigenes]QIJ71670.1 argininosuccinate lyase [Thermosulfuriphilus ammonigenes]
MSKEKPWAGRFKEKTARSVEEFTVSVEFDSRLAYWDILGSKVHARMLARQGIISEEDAQKIIEGLEKIWREIESGRFRWRSELEDVHMNIEAALIELIGPAGARLHTARSRNDQVATDVRLYLRDEIDDLCRRLQGLQQALVDKAEENIQVIMPGFTHLQHAQPILFAHHLMAYFEMFQRDRERLADCRRRLNYCPLGSAALAGTGFPVDRHFVARELGFTAPCANSLDAVSDRDFIIEFLGAAALIMMHLSRLSEELILWMSSEFAFVDLPDAYCTGSSIMPQKKNPDVPELIRGKSGRVFGHLLSLLTTMKALPLAYNRDMQEDKEPLFDTVDTVKTAVAIMGEIVAHLKPRPERMREVCEEGFLTATDLADYLVEKGLAFREAHAVAGRVVAYALERGRRLWELSLEELRRFSELIDEDLLERLSIEGSVARRNSFGGTAPERVKEAIASARTRLSQDET